MEYCGFCLRRICINVFASREIKVNEWDYFVPWFRFTYTLQYFFQINSILRWNCYEFVVATLLLLLLLFVAQNCLLESLVTHSDCILRAHVDNVSRRDALLLRSIAFVNSQNESGRTWCACVYLYFTWILMQLFVLYLVFFVLYVFCFHLLHRRLIKIIYNANRILFKYTQAIYKDKQQKNESGNLHVQHIELIHKMDHWERVYSNSYSYCFLFFGVFLSLSLRSCLN